MEDEEKPFLKKAEEQLKLKGATIFAFCFIHFDNDCIESCGQCRINEKIYDFCFSEDKLELFPYVDYYMENNL